MALVLAVDDRKELLDGIAQVLEPEHSCIMTSSGADALQAYMNNRPSLVLLDLIMPGMSGREVAQRILEMDPKARIVIFSIVENVREIVELFRQGICDFIPKPCDGKKLIEIVNSNLNLLPEPVKTSEAYASTMREEILRFMDVGKSPVLIGHRGIGKRTALREAFRAAGVHSPVVIGPISGRRPAKWFSECIRLTRKEPVGIIAWAQGKTLADLGSDEGIEWWSQARMCTQVMQGRFVGITVDLPVDGADKVPLPGPESGFGILQVEPLSNRPEDIAAFIAHIESCKTNRHGCSAESVMEAIRNHPGHANLNSVRVMVEVPGFLRHVIGESP